MSLIILPIRGCSDGDPSKRPSASATSHVRNDSYYLDRVANDWAVDLGISRPGVTYRLDRLPAGYSCYEKTRDGTKHTDRYLFGHPKGQFRSFAEFYPHFKWLMDHDTPDGCTCKLCGKTKAAVPSSARSVASSNSPHRAQPVRQPTQPLAPVSRKPPKQTAQSRTDLLEGRPADPPAKRRKVDTDREGTPDVFASLIRKLETAGPDGLDESIAEYHSPDWRAGHNMLVKLLKEWKELPPYVPRVGEVVLFTRPTADANAPQVWEAGVVGQMTDESLSDEDLFGIPQNKSKSHVTFFGFRIEPFALHKSVNNRSVYVPLHGLRPLYLFKECLQDVEESDWHPTIQNALKIMSSFCLISRHHFKGKWPDASIFSEGLYIGTELIIAGDIIRLQNRSGSGDPNVITDIMQVTAIQLCILNLDDPEVNGWDPAHPYQTCLHIRGRPYTLDPAKSFDSPAKYPISAHSGILPPGISALGQWYHMLDPQNLKIRIEVPFTRVLGRCPTAAAFKAWSNGSPKALNPQDPYANLNRGLDAILQARVYSTTHDFRIRQLVADSHAMKTWLWADTRVEQLDLHEINNVSVGSSVRGPLELLHWRQALEALNGNKKSLEKLKAVQKEKKYLQLQGLGHTEYSDDMTTVQRTFGSSQMAASSAVGMMARKPSPFEVDSGTEDGAGSWERMEVDEDVRAGGLGQQRSVSPIDVDSDESDSEDELGAAAILDKGRKDHV